MIRVGICGYGNLGKGVEKALKITEDMELVGVFTRRDVNIIKSEAKIYPVENLDNMTEDIDVLILCGGSANDLMTQSPKYAEQFNIVDSFDTHAKIPEHFMAVNEAALKNNHVAVISAGWDPGMFSINRVYGEALLPKGETYTFWGKGVSQGHSDAIRRIENVVDAVQYTVPIEEAISKVRSGENPNFTTREKHLRICYVVASEKEDYNEIEKQIVNMPNYFDEYDAQVNFITKKEFEDNHKGMPHGGFVIRSGDTGGNKQKYEFSLELESNPEFTASTLVAYGRSAYRLNKMQEYGAKTVLEIPPYLLSPRPIEELRRTHL